MKGFSIYLLLGFSLWLAGCQDESLPTVSSGDALKTQLRGTWTPVELALNYQVGTTPTHGVFGYVNVWQSGHGGPRHILYSEPGYSATGLFFCSHGIRGWITLANGRTDVHERPTRPLCVRSGLTR